MEPEDDLLDRSYWDEWAAWEEEQDARFNEEMNDAKRDD